MGNYKGDSDIDLAIMSDYMLFDDLLDLHAQLEKIGMLYKIDMLDLRKITKPALLEHISNLGKIFYKCELVNSPK